MTALLVRQGGAWVPLLGSVPTPPDFPDVNNAGIPAGMSLLRVPEDVTSGTGWTWNASQDIIVVTGDNAVLDGLQLTNAIIDIRADNAAVSNCKINCAGTGVFGIALRSVSGPTITHCEIGGLRPNGGPDPDGSGRLQYGVKDILTDSTDIEISYSQFYDTANTISCPVNANIHDNLIHKMGFVDSDHIDCILSEGSQHVVIQHNTLLCEQGQTSAIALYSQQSASDDVLVDNNLLGGGGYTVYGGDSTASGQFGGTLIRITNNQFTTQGGLFPNSGQFGPYAHFDPNGTGNEFSGNTWADGPNAGQAIS